MASVVIPINLQCGALYWIQFVATDTTTGNPVAVTSPKMEIRQGAFGDPNSTDPLLYTSEGGSPTIVITQPSSNIVLATILGSTTKNQLQSQVGYFDAYAVDPLGNPIILGNGMFKSKPNITAL